MADVSLRSVSRTTGSNRDLKDGTVPSGRFALDFEDVPVLVHAFRRMVRALEYDVCEMAITTYLCAKAHGKRFTALPIFLLRGFHHGAILANQAAGLRSPADLEGRRVGVSRGYTVTTGVWARGILQEEHHVDLDRVTWVLSGDEHVAEYEAPPNVVPIEAGGDLGEMLVLGELAATVGVKVDHPDIAPLVPNAAEAGYAALRERGHYPINHLVVVRDDLLEAHPDLAIDVFNAFAEAKTRYVQRLRDGTIGAPSATDRMHKRVMEILGEDPLPYGIEPNRATLETLIRHAVDQRILAEAPPLESLFAAGTHDLIA